MFADQENETYALDLTAAQFGYHAEPITPWSKYIATRVESVGAEVPAGHFKTSMSKGGLNKSSAKASAGLRATVVEWAMDQVRGPISRLFEGRRLFRGS
jgi:hypothetical protein